jgi:hypothetical protein
MSAVLLYTDLVMTGNTASASPAPGEKIAGKWKPVPCAPTWRCVYCAHCGLFLGGFHQAGEAPFAALFAPQTRCLCTMPLDTLLDLLLTTEEKHHAVGLYCGRIYEAFLELGCSPDLAEEAIEQLYPLSAARRAWLERFLAKHGHALPAECA